MDIKSLLLSEPCVLGVKGRSFIFIAANTVGVEDHAPEQPSPARPLIGAVGCSVDKVLFSDFILDVAWKYKNNKTVAIPLKYWNELAPQLRNLPSSPFGLNIVLAGIDNTGRGLKELFEPKSFFQFCASFGSNSITPENIFPNYHQSTDIALCRESVITSERAEQLAHMLYTKAAIPATRVEMHIIPMGSNDTIVSKVYVKKDEILQKEIVKNK